MLFTLNDALDFEGREIPVEPGDSVASALYRAGVRVFSRSFKYHRRRGLYCLTGDCPNCMLNVDGDPCVRACVTAAAPGQRVHRETGWPSADRDALGVLDRMHRLLPVGFYYKTLLRPRWAWPRAEPMVRRVAGRGTITQLEPPANREARHAHPDVVVIGAGVAGLSAALAAAEAGRTVLLCDEGRPGEKVAAGPDRERIDELARAGAASERITVLEQSPAIGIYEGPLVVINAPDLLHLAHPESVIVATGAVDEHGVFPGNDLPGVWLARGAARLAGVHGVLPGRRIVVAGGSSEAEQHAGTLRAAGADVTLAEGRVVEARGGKHLERVVIERGSAREEIDCDALVLALGLVARDGLVLQAAGLPVVTVGDAATPGLSLAEAEEQGRRAGRGEPDAQRAEAALPGAPREGIVCLCEDVGVDELDQAWQEGFRSTEIVKRYTTATMGPCQGAMCHRHVRAFIASRPGATGPAHGPMTARPPTRGITLMEAAAGVRDEVHQHTALHERHLALDATMEPAGAWRRPKHYGDALAEYWAVRKGVSVMDVGTLGKFLVAGPDATAFLERLYPCRVSDLEPGRFRYAVLLGEHGFVIDDGIVCALGDDRWYVTFTSSGAAAMEATLKDWAETFGHDVHIADLTAAWGAINVAGPRSRELLQRLSCGPARQRRVPLPPQARADRRGRAVQRDQAGVRRRALVRAASPQRPQRRALGRAARGRARSGHPPARARRAAAAAAREGPHHHRPGHRLRRHAGKAQHELGRAPGEALVRRQARSRARRRARGAAQARRRVVPLGRAGRGRSAARRRPPRGPAHLVGLVARARLRRRARLGRAGERGIPEHVGERGRPRKRGRPRVLRSRGRATPCLSSSCSQAGPWAASRDPAHSTHWRRAPTCRCASRRPSCSCSARRAALAELAQRLAALDPHGLTLDLSSAYATWVVRGDDRLEAFARLSAIPLPAPGGFAQGLVAHVPAKVVVREDDLLVTVSSVVSHHLRDRLPAACRDLAEVAAR